MKHIKAIVRDYLARRLHVPEIPYALQRLAALGFEPRLIYDVGAYRGEFAKLALSIWPTASIFCFEPLPHKVKELKNSGLPVRVFDCLVGEENREGVTLHQGETASSVLTEHINQSFPISEHSMRTIDSIAEETGRHPDFIKIDVQGYELNVLKGAEATLRKSQAILAEINLLDIHIGVPLLHDMISWLSERDWLAYDICGLTRRPLDNALWQCDMVFVPASSVLRHDKQWG